MDYFKIIWRNDFRTSNDKRKTARLLCYYVHVLLLFSIIIFVHIRCILKSQSITIVDTLRYIRTLPQTHATSFICCIRKSLFYRQRSNHCLMIISYFKIWREHHDGYIQLSHQSFRPFHQHARNLFICIQNNQRTNVSYGLYCATVRSSPSLNIALDTATFISVLIEYSYLHIFYKYI